MHAFSLDTDGVRSRFLLRGVLVVGVLRCGSASSGATCRSGCDFFRASACVCSERLRLSPSCDCAALVPVVPTAD